MQDGNLLIPNGAKQAFGILKTYLREADHTGAGEQRWKNLLTPKHVVPNKSNSLPYKRVQPSGERFRLNTKRRLRPHDVVRRLGQWC